MVRRAVGSNQYRTRPGTDGVPLGAGPDLVAQAAADPRRMHDSERRCGEVWGTRCRARVLPPFFSHGRHGLMEPDGLGRFRPKHLAVESALQDPDCPPALLEWAATHTNPKYRHLAAGHHRCPEPLMQLLAQDPNDEVARALASNWSCPPDVLVRLSHRSVHVMAAVAGHPYCPPEVLMHLPVDNSGVAWGVANNPNTPAVRLRQLALDPGFSCRDRAIRNPSCPPHLAVQMLADDDPRLRQAASQSAALPEEYRGLVRVQ